MRGETKDSVLEGGFEYPDITAFSVHDTKTVYFLSMAAEKLVWNKNEKDIYDKETKKKVKLQFYCTELQILNTNYMNSVDVAYQLWNSYHFQHWMRNRKWWWKLCVWGFGVIPVNVYILYTKDHLLLSLYPSSVLPNRTHNWAVEFRTQIIGKGSIMLHP